MHDDDLSEDIAPFPIRMGLSDEEKQDLEQMIGEFRQNKGSTPDDIETMQKQIETINKRMAYLTSMFMTIDRSLKPLSEVVRLTLEKCDLLNQRINTIIDSLRSGEPL